MDLEVLAAFVVGERSRQPIWSDRSSTQPVRARADGISALRGDDVAAEVFRVAFERRETYDPAYSSAKPWLFGIAANVARQHHRRTARRRDVHERLVAEDRPEPHPGPEQRLTRLAATEPVAEAILDLPDRDREPLLLFAWADLTYDEIAQALDVPVGTVRSRIHRARSQVRARLDRESADVEPGGVQS